MEQKLFNSNGKDRDLGGKASQGAILVTISYAFEKVTKMASLIVLARLLAPDEFGLVAMAMLVIGALTIFNDFGVSAAVVYKKEKIQLVADNALFVTLFFGPALALIGFLLAPAAAAYFRNDNVTAIIQVLSLLIAVKAFGSIPAALLQKELDFKRKIIPEVSRSAIYAILAITLAYLGWGVWSLVIGELGSSIVGLLLIWLVAGWKPRFRFDFEIARDVLSYGKHVTLTSVFMFVAANIDYAIVGRLLGTSALGLYMIAFKLATYPADTLRLVSNVIFPMFSKLEYDKERMGRVYLKSLNYVSFLVMPVGFFILIAAPTLIEVMFGRKWLGASQATQALVWFGIARVLMGNTTGLFKATGRPDLPMKLEAVKLILLVPLLYFLTSYGILAVGVVQSVLMLVFTPFYVGFVIRILGIRLADFIKVLQPTVLSCLFMVVCTVIGQGLIKTKGLHLSSVLIFSGSTGIALLSYLAAVFIINRETVFGIIDVLSRGLRVKLLTR